MLHLLGALESNGDHRPHTTMAAAAAAASSSTPRRARPSTGSSSSTSAAAGSNAHLQHRHILQLSSDLDVICFKRNGSRRSDGLPPSQGPFFVVREWDSKVIRGIKKQRMQRPQAPTTEQALRASVRQAILNMNLALEPANKHEIQYLKSVGILGKRAPSASLLNLHDILKLLYCFGKKRAAEQLTEALQDEERSKLGDSSVLISRVYAKIAPKPIVLVAAPKTPIPVSAVPIRAVELNVPQSFNLWSKRVPLARSPSVATPAATEAKKRKLEQKAAQSAAAGEASLQGQGQNAIKEHAARAAAAAAAGLGVEGLDALLTALRKPNEATASTTTVATVVPEVSHPMTDIDPNNLVIQVNGFVDPNGPAGANDLDGQQAKRPKLEHPTQSLQHQQPTHHLPLTASMSPSPPPLPIAGMLSHPSVSPEPSPPSSSAHAFPALHLVSPIPPPPSSLSSSNSAGLSALTTSLQQSNVAVGSVVAQPAYFSPALSFRRTPSNGGNGGSGSGNTGLIRPANVLIPSSPTPGATSSTHPLQPSPDSFFAQTFMSPMSPIGNATPAVNGL